MNFHLYFHDDLDGTATGAVFLKFLRSRGDAFATYTPLEYGPVLNNGWRERTFQSPSVLVDFRYHPLADWWIDHHATAFLFDEWKDGYTNDGQHYYDPSAQSCCGAMIAFLKKEHHYEAPPYHHTLAQRVDVIDSASFENGEEAISTSIPHMRLSLLIDEYAKKEDAHAYQEFRKSMIERLAEEPYEQIVTDPTFTGFYQKAEKLTQKEIEHVKEHAQLRGRVIYIDHSGRGMPFNRFIPFYLFPQQLYGMTIIKTEGVYKVTFSVNPWRKTESPLRLGDIARTYGGGGHRSIGALRVTTKEEALKIANEVLTQLNANHLIT